MTRIKREFIGIKLMSKFINIAIASSKLQKLYLPSGKLIRPNLHLMIYGTIGTGKSSILYEIADKKKIGVTQSISKACYLGTVDKNTGMFIPPVIWTYRNNCLLIDEFNIDFDNSKNNNTYETLLSLMENPQFIKPIGLRINEYTKKTKDLFCIVKDSMINIKTRFSFICTTMIDPYTRKNKQNQAFLSRLIVLFFNPEFEDLDRFINGESLYDYIDLPASTEVKISQEVQNDILKILMDKKITKENYMRTFGDFCRIYAILGKHDLELYEYILNQRNNSRVNY